MTLQKRALALVMATALAVPAEGIRRVAYYDPPGILTVCRGHTGPDVVAGKVYSLAECDAYMTADMKKAVAQVDACVPDAPTPVLAAFSDAVFNLGPKIACDATASTAARKLKAKDWSGACQQLGRWVYANVGGFQVVLPGLVKRRQMETEICLQGTVK